MPRFLLACACALLLAAGTARAEGAPTACASIADRDCPPLPRVTAKGNLRVEVVTRKRRVLIPLAGAATEEDYTDSCPDGKCECTEIVQYFDFKGPVPGFRQVNADEFARAAKAKCSVDNSNVTREARRFAVSDAFVSTAFYELEYCRTCGGSCHGRTTLSTFDAQTGRALVLRDVLRPDAVAPLRAHMANYAAKAYADEVDRPAQRGFLAQELAQRPLLDDGFFVEDGKVFVDLDSFAFGCAGGSFYPVPVPPAMLTSAAAAKL